MLSKSWYPITKRPIEILEASDANFFQMCFGTNSKTVRDAYYLETGKLKIRHAIAKRRMLYLHTVLNRGEQDLVKKVYLAQKLVPARHDWANLVKKDKEIYEVDLSDDEIAEMSKNKYKKYIEVQVNKRSFEELMSSKKSKVSRIVESIDKTKVREYKLPIQEYLKTNDLSKEMKIVLFSLRSREYDLKVNYKSMYENNMQCRICQKEDSIEDEEHTFFQCESLIDIGDIDRNHKVDHIFGDLKQQLSVMQHIMEVTRKRNIIINLHNINQS